MTTPRLGEPIVTDGARSINFFNGRLLSAEDLRTEQDFEASARRRLGLGVGDGVVTGLLVRRSSTGSTTRPVVSVARGHAVNRNGDVVTLPVDVDVDLTATGPAAGGPASETAFGPCAEVGPVGRLGTGVYLLVVRPAGVRRGRAPTNGLDADPACATDAVVEGAAFGLVPLDLPGAILGDDQRPLLRSRVAHLMLGTEDPRRVPGVDPLAASDGRWGLLDDLRAAGSLDDACVPIAVVSWAVRRGVEFVDPWAVRRQPVRPSAGLRWLALLGDRARAEAEATQQQFQVHVDDLVAAGGDLSRVRARDLFAYLPAVGAVPIGSRGGATFDAGTFLGSHGSRELDILDGDQLVALLADGLLHRPVAPDGPASRFRRYWVVENLTAVAAGADVPLSMVFAAEGVARRGTSRFGLAITGASTFAATVDVPLEG